MRSLREASVNTIPLKAFLRRLHSITTTNQPINSLPPTNQDSWPIMGLPGASKLAALASVFVARDAVVAAPPAAPWDVTALTATQNESAFACWQLSAPWAHAS